MVSNTFFKAIKELKFSNNFFDDEYSEKLKVLNMKKKAEARAYFSRKIPKNFFVKKKFVRRS